MSDNLALCIIDYGEACYDRAPPNEDRRHEDDHGAGSSESSANAHGVACGGFAGSGDRNGPGDSDEYLNRMLEKLKTISSEDCEYHTWLC